MPQQNGMNRGNMQQPQYGGQPYQQAQPQPMRAAQFQGQIPQNPGGNAGMPPNQNQPQNVRSAKEARKAAKKARNMSKDRTK